MSISKYVYNKITSRIIVYTRVLNQTLTGIQLSELKCSRVRMYSVTRKRKIGIQVGCAAVDRKEKGVQCSHSTGSYGWRHNETGILTYDELLQNYLWTKDYTIEWLKEEKQLKTSRQISYL